MGSGRYSQKLSYEEWYKFNNAQRAHLNFVEWIAPSVVLILVGGLYFPIVSASLGLAVIIARALYAIGYMINGASNIIRAIGAIGNDILVLAILFLAYISAIYLILNR